MTDETSKPPALTADQSVWLNNISHEIRTPLCHITGFPDLQVQLANDPLKVAEYAGYIKESGQRAMDLVDGMLQLFREKPDGVTLEDLNARFALVPFRPGHDSKSSAYPQANNWGATGDGAKGPRTGG